MLLFRPALAPRVYDTARPAPIIMKFLILTTFVTLGAAWVVPNFIAIETSLTTTNERSYDQDAIVTTKAETSPRATHSLTIIAPPPSVNPIEPVTLVRDENWY